ncbi:MAG: CHAT domain-containing protein [Actinomycetota bacterium]
MKLTRSLRQAILWFFLSGLLAVTIPPVVAQVQPPQTIVQSQPSPLQLIQQARTLYDRSRFSEAVPLLQQAATAFEAKGDRLNQATALSNLAATFGQQTQWEAAEQAVNSSLSLLQSQPPTPEQQRILAQTQDIQAQLQFERGRFQDALNTWVQTAKLYQQLDDPKQLIQIQISQSQALEALGLYPRACKTLLAALKQNHESCELSATTLQTWNSQPISLQNLRAIDALGHVLRVLGQLEQSQQLLALGWQAAEKLGIPQEQATLMLNLGNTAHVLSKQPGLKLEQRDRLERSTLEAYAQAAQLATSPETQIQARLNYLSLLIDAQKWSEAEALWRSPPFQSLPFSSTRAGLFAQINLADSLIQLAPHTSGIQIGEIEELLNRAMAQANRLGDDRIHAELLGTQGHLAELQQQYSRSETLTTQALSLAPPFQAPDIAYQMLWQLGRIRKAQGDTEGAIEQYTQAVNVLASLRGDLVAINPDVQFSFRETVEPVYRDLVGLLLQAPSPSQTKLKQARQTIESLQLAELDNFFRDACADAKPKAIDEVDPSAAVLYPIILSDRLEVIASIPGQPLRHYSTPKPQAELEQTFRQVRNSLRQTAIAKERLPLAQKLYDWLIRPVESELAASGIKTLVFVLDGYLRNLPMAALHDGQQYLIQKYSVALTPGLQLLEPRRLAQIKLKALTAGITEARQGFPALPAVESEVQQIANTLPTNTLLNQQFLSRELQARIKATSFPIVHLATHGQFSSNAADTFILTWDERINVKEFDRLLRSGSEEKKSPIELLILSACQTATGDDRATLGLAGLAIRSGARSTVGTLWTVNDESTSVFMAEFYRQLAKPNISKAEALRNAQLTLLQNSEFQKPYFWAPFVLVGNWQ